MGKYGSDKPDLRIPLEFTDVADLVAPVDFKVFAGPAKDPKGRVVALRVPGGASISRKQIDEYTKYVGIYGAKGLAWIKVNELEKGAEEVWIVSPDLHYDTENDEFKNLFLLNGLLMTACSTRSYSTISS